MSGVSGAFGSPRGKSLELLQKPITRASPAPRVHEPGDIPKRNPTAFSWWRMSTASLIHLHDLLPALNEEGFRT